MGAVESTTLTTLRAAVRAVRSTTHLATEQLGSFIMRDLDEQVPIFARNMPGEILQPVTMSAERMLGGSNGARVRRILDAATTLADERPGSTLRGLVLPGDPDALMGWWRLRELADDTVRHPDAAAGAVMSRLLHRLDQAAVAANDDFTAFAHESAGFIVDLKESHLRSLLVNSPDSYERYTRSLLSGLDEEVIARVMSRDGARARFRTDQLTKLMHEVEHTHGITDYMAGDRNVAELSRIYEEGSTQVVAHWPGRRTAFAQRAGLLDEVDRAYLESSVPASYGDEHAVMLDLVARAGLDPAEPDAITGAIHLLRGRRRFGDALSDVASAIERHEGRPVDLAELQRSMLRTPVTDAFRIELAREGLAIPAGLSLP